MSCKRDSGWSVSLKYYKFASDTVWMNRMIGFSAEKCISLHAQIENIPEIEAALEHLRGNLIAVRSELESEKTVNRELQVRVAICYEIKDMHCS